MISGVRDRFVRTTHVPTTPLLPDGDLGLLDPVWSVRVLHGRVDAVRPGVGWGGHRPGQHVGEVVRTRVSAAADDVEIDL